MAEREFDRDFLEGVRREVQKKALPFPSLQSPEEVEGNGRLAELLREMLGERGITEPAVGTTSYGQASAEMQRLRGEIGYVERTSDPFAELPRARPQERKKPVPQPPAATPSAPARPAVPQYFNQFPPIPPLPIPQGIPTRPPNSRQRQRRLEEILGGAERELIKSDSKYFNLIQNYLPSVSSGIIKKPYDFKENKCINENKLYFIKK